MEGTGITFGFDTVLQIATDAIDHLHTTATSHHRVIVCEIMGHKTGWLALSAGIARGADIILIPEIPYDINVVADYLLKRRRHGSRFSIIALTEGTISIEDVRSQAERSANGPLTAEQTPKSAKKKKKTKSTGDLTTVMDDIDNYYLVREPISSRIAHRLQEMTGIEARVTSLGHVQRGGIPTAFDRPSCTQLGTKAAQLLTRGVYNGMVGYDSRICKPVPMEQVAGKRKSYPSTTL